VQDDVGKVNTGAWCNLALVQWTLKLVGCV
jgi:hypothetical protein